MSFEEWKEYKLVELSCNFLSGYAFKSSDYANDGVPLIKIGNIQNRTVEVSLDGDFVSKKLISVKTQKFLLKNNDVLIAMTGQGSVGRVGRLRLNNEQEVFLNQRVGKFICDEKNLNLDFLFYTLASKQYQELLYNNGIGSGQPNLSPEVILNTRITWINYHTQRRIASILTSLDDKIELNRQTAQTLEAITQALFKEWFVDFNFPGATGQMQDSELGEIPVGWKVGKLGEIALVVTGKTPSSTTPEHFGNYLPFITPTDFKNYNKLIIDSDRKVSEKGANALKNKILPVNSVIVTCIGSDMGKVAINKIACITNQQINSLVPNQKNITDYLYCYLLSKYDLLRSIASGGSTMPIINKSQFEEIKIIIPSVTVLDGFKKIVNSLNDSLENYLKQTQTLTQLRDTLLPKLMKGEINVHPQPA